ncbi:MAG: phosphate transport system regulatory protein [Actinomycetota bacterium]
MEELRKGFHKDLADLRAEVLGLGRSVVGIVDRATSVLLAGDLEGAEYIILNDDEVDARSIDLEDRCYHILALQSPVAGDLRQLIAVLKMIGEIERSADLAVNIAKASRRIYGHRLPGNLSDLVGKMSEQSQQLFDAAMTAFFADDVAKAAALDDMDSFLDDLQRQFVQAVLESHSAGMIELQVAIQLAVVARFYERIGDHAVNIGERVRFLVDGWRPESKGAERHRAKTGQDASGEVPRALPEN